MNPGHDVNLEPCKPGDSALYNHDTVTVARELLGCLLCRETEEGFTAGMIVETEAYLSSGDAACHASRGMTIRNAPMFGPPGRAYVYFIYGKHFCFNVVTGAEGSGEAVLVRALEPLAGFELMISRRGGNCSVENLTSGPGKLCRALAIDRRLNGHNLRQGPLWVAAGDGKHDFTVINTTRVGVSAAAGKALRFYISGNKFVSRR